MLQKISDLLIGEAVIAGSPELLKQREKDIRSNPRLLRRVGASVIHTAVHSTSPELLRRLFELPYVKAGYEVLGHGHHATTVREHEAETVKKIIRASRSLPTDQLQVEAEQLRHLISRTLHHHPDISHPSTVMVGSAPPKGLRAITIEQPFVRITDDSADPDVIKDFATKSLDEMMSDGYLPDVAGVSNICNTIEGVRLIDTVPISSKMPIYPRCAEILRAMAKHGTLPKA